MKPGQNHDQLEVINGPEDGSIFHLIRTPVDIGANPQCAITLQLDPGIGEFHARLTIDSNAYRIRATGKHPVSVNEKRAGAIRSQLVKHGDIVRVGQTQMALYFAEEGLARRSQGIKRESDFRWALYLFKRRLYSLFSRSQRPAEDGLKHY